MESKYLKVANETIRALQVALAATTNPGTGRRPGPLHHEGKTPAQQIDHGEGTVHQAALHRHHRDRQKTAFRNVTALFSGTVEAPGSPQQHNKIEVGSPESFISGSGHNIMYLL